MKLVNIIPDDNDNIRRFEIDFETTVFATYTNPNINIHRYIDLKTNFTEFGNSHLTVSGGEFIRNFLKIPGIDDVSVTFHRFNNIISFTVEKSEHFSWNFINKSIVYIIQNDLTSLYNLIKIHKMIGHSLNDNIFNTSYLKAYVNKLTISSGKPFLKYPYLNLNRVRCGVHRPSCKFFMMEMNDVINVNNYFTRYGLNILNKLYYQERFDGEIIYFNCRTHKLSVYFVNNDYITNNVGLSNTTRILRSIGIKNPLFY